MKISYISLAILSLVHCMDATDAETHKTRAQLLKEGLEADGLDARDLISPGPPYASQPSKHEVKNYQIADSI